LVRAFEEILKVRDAMTYRMLPILLLFALFFTVFTSYNAVAPILKLQKAFTAIHIRSSNEHISLNSNYREFSQFIDYFNALIDRLRTSYLQAARFSSDASHELRTPLTIIRGHIDRLIHQAPDGSQMQQSLALVGDEVERLIAITNKLLWLSQADAGQMRLDKQVVKFNDMVGQMVDDLRMFNAHLDFSCDLKHSIVLTCDQDLLRQLLSNLFSNAIKYNYAEGSVKFVAQAKDELLSFTVSNTTHLSLEGLDDRVFERFYRYREGANQQVTDKSGSGLGLSLCREILRAHGGGIHLSLNHDGMVQFECTMPLA
jgi:signal transduction histidine kinase